MASPASKIPSIVSPLWLQMNAGWQVAPGKCLAHTLLFVASQEHTHMPEQTFWQGRESVG